MIALAAGLLATVLLNLTVSVLAKRAATPRRRAAEPELPPGRHFTAAGGAIPGFPREIP